MIIRKSSFRDSFASAVTVLGLAVAFMATPVDARPPNLVLIMADDLGYNEVGAYGQEIIETPSLDKMAAEGKKFTQFYSGAPVCAPARCVLMTGKHSGHAYVRGNGNPPERRELGKKLKDPLFFPGQTPIPPAEVTIAEALKARGYATGGMGKWGLGFEGSTGDPNNQGFDLFFGFLCQVHAHNHYPRYLYRNGERVMLDGNDRKLEGEQHSQDLFIEEALGFIRENKDQPFFLYLPFAIPHLSIQTTEDYVEYYKKKIPEEEYKHRGYLPHPFPRAGYAGMVTQMDHGIGQVMDLIKELGLDDNTLVIFTSDNGPTYNRLGGSDSDYFKSAGPFRGLKGSVYEGGIRVPMIARWPGKIKPGTTSDHLAAFWDFFPTLGEAAGADMPKGLDGISFLPELVGEKQKPHDFLYWEFPSYGGQQALRTGPWKAVRQNLHKGKTAFELYNLADDPGETKDVAAEHPERVARMAAIMKAQHVPNDRFPIKVVDDGQ